MIFDAHHHLWKVSRGDYHWMTPSMAVLARDYLVADLQPELQKAGVTRTIVVQAAATEAETEFLLGIAARTSFIAGVTGWLDLADRDFPRRLEHFRKDSKFVAIRPMIHDVPNDAWILEPQVLGNLKHISEVGFRFEFLTFPRHLPYVLRALEQVPELHAVMDHLSKPPIAKGALEPWASLMTQVADYPNVYCKISGMVTEARHDSWTPESLAPYVHHVIDVFGSDRLIFGSDWPVCRLAAEYSQVVAVARSILSDRIEAGGMEKVMFKNAERFYLT
jgi:L-fuconolactonase